MTVMAAVTALAGTVAFAVPRWDGAPDVSCAWDDAVDLGASGLKLRTAGQGRRVVVGIIGQNGSGLLLADQTGQPLPLPPVPDGADWIGIQFDSSGTLYSFWAARPEHADTAQAALLASVLAGDGWSHPSEVVRARWLGGRYAGWPVRASDGTVHLAIPARIDRGVPHLLYVSGTAYVWQHQHLPRWPAGYPSLFSDGDTVFMASVGPAAVSAPDVNSVWVTRIGRGPPESAERALVSRSGSRPAFEPVLVAGGSRLDVVWTKDVREPAWDRDALLHAYSQDRGRSWTEPTTVDAGGHIRQPHLVRDSAMGLFAIYTKGAVRGAPAGLWLAAGDDGGGWGKPQRLLRGENISDFSALSGGNGLLHLVYTTRATRRTSARTWYLTGTCARSGR